MHLFIFRRDLRIEDNLGLIAAASAMATTNLKGSKGSKGSSVENVAVMPVFIYNQKQIKPKQNPYFSERAFEFMQDCIADLKDACPALRVFETRSSDIVVLKAILKAHPQIKAVYFNADLASPFARVRDAEIADFCTKANIACVQHTGDYSLVDPSEMAKPYQVFTAFYKKYKDTVQEEIVHAKAKYHNKTRNPIHFIPCACKQFLSKLKIISKTDNNRSSPRQDAMKKLALVRKGAFKNYKTTRDEIANEQGTTRLSAHLKFGSISVREAFLAASGHGNEALKREFDHGNEALKREFMIRSFYDQLAYHFQFAPIRFKTLKWTGSNEHFDAWTHHRTGFPLVDAAMCQLATTGFMHNRCRMLVASFLVKALHVDWRRGERWFATQLVDYHPASNNGGWQWASGTGSDAQPYFRYFSPWIQSAKHDPDATYIKRYIPELATVPAKSIHTWFKSHSTYKHIDYPAPIIDHATEIRKTMAYYKSTL